MKFIFELSKEHKTLPKSEIISCLKAEKINFDIIEENYDVLIIDTNSKNEIIEKISNRLSFTFHIDEFLFSCSNNLKEIRDYSLDNPIKKKGSLAIRYRNRSSNLNSQRIVKMLGEIYSHNRIVSLEKPDIEIRGLMTDSKLYVGVKLSEIDRSQYENRKVQYRPFFSPISLHPKLARIMVNLALVKKNDVILDPFCGTGGILIESGLIGLKVIGSDIEEKMVKGCIENLNFYKIKNYKLFCLDIGDINRYVSKVDAVVTDFPYGKSTTTKGENLLLLYDRAFSNISSVLKEGGRAVIGLSNEDMVSLGKKYFSFVEKHDYKAHRSLTRFFAVYQK